MARIPFIITVICIMTGMAWASESVWIEAEQLVGIEGYCWPMAADPSMKTTHGKWGISGPGCASEWIQGGESGFNSIACGAEDDAALATRTIEVPEDGMYAIWVRYRDNRGTSERFQIRLEQQGQAAWTGTYGVKPVIDEDNIMKLYWNWAFAWDNRTAELRKGTARISLLAGFKEAQCRQIDVIVLTSDKQYRPLIKERPQNYSRQVLDQYRKMGLVGIEPLARRHGKYQTPVAWAPKTFNNRGFLYLWNVDDYEKWATGDPKLMRYPYHLRDDESKAAFEAKYAGKDEVPIFSDPRIVPAFYGPGPWVLDLDGANPKKTSAAAFRKWLDADPNRLWAGMMNYAPDDPISAQAADDFVTKYRDRYVGNISGENLGYFYPTPEKVTAAVAGAKNRRELAEAMGKVFMEANAAKYQTIFGKELPNPYLDVISCLSNEMSMYAPLCYLWGARTVGYESAVASYNSEAMFLSFLRGAARQNGGLTATYRSCNFGDSATMFSETQMFTKPSAIFDNYYDVYSGAGMGWYKFDMWYQYMSGSSMYYHEQGFDEFWIPGGMAMGKHELQLSPKGKIVDRFLSLTKNFDRGIPFTPIAFLADYAHGWSPIGYTPDIFGGHALRPDLTRWDDHSQMMQQYLFTAFYPIIPHSEQSISALSETFVPAVFGDIYDVIYAYPDVKRWTTIDTYPVVISIGDIALTAPEGQRLAKYLEDGGTLVVADGQLSGPGLVALQLPKMGDIEESTGYLWLNETNPLPSQRFRFRAIEGGRVLARTTDGKAFCSAFDRGQGRLIVLSTPRGLGIDREIMPVVPRLFAHLASNQMPIEVDGEVEWMLNRQQNGWAVTLLNPAGDMKPQHGILPIDYTKNLTVTIRAKVPITNASDHLAPDDQLIVQDNTVSLPVQAGSLRIIELR